MMEILKPPYVTNLPRLDQPAGPSVATIQENKKPAAENQPKPIYKISPPPAPLPVEDSQIDQQAGPSAATVHELNKPAKKFFDEGTPTRRKLKGMEASAIVSEVFEIHTSLFELLGLIATPVMTCGEDHRKTNQRRLKKKRGSTLAHPFLYIRPHEHFAQEHRGSFKSHSTISH